MGWEPLSYNNMFFMSYPFMLGSGLLSSFIQHILEVKTLFCTCLMVSLFAFQLQGIIRDDYTVFPPFYPIRLLF